MISKLKDYARNTLTWYRLISFLLFLVAMFVLIFVIGHLDRSIHLENLRKIVLIAGLVGLVFSMIRNLKPVPLILLSFLSGVIVAFTLTGRLLDRYVTFLETGFSFLFALIEERLTSGEISPDPSLVQEQWRSLVQSISVLGNRLFGWLVSQPDSTYDPVSLNLIWGIVIWLATIWAFWFVLNRKQALVGFLPPLGIIASSVPSIESGLNWLAFILGIGLLLVVIGNYANQDEDWKKHYFTISHRIWEIVAQYAVLLSVAVVVFAAFMTSPKLEDLLENPRQRWQGSGEGNGGGSASGEEDELATVAREMLGETAKGWFPNDHLIGSGPELSEVKVFHAKVEEPSTGLATGFYFRSASYETYTQKGWQNTGKEVVQMPAKEIFEISLTPREYLIYQEVTLLQGSPNGNLMYVVGELAVTNVSYYGAYHTKFVNITYKDLFAAVTNESLYRAYSLIPNFGEDEIRNASQEYPPWIKNKFLQIPDSTSDRVYELAISLTATQATPYDRAVAIEDYLREFEYTLDIDTPPRNRDIVDYFLFDLQKGYCDYFASAMVILARAAGLPARLATGYLASTYDSDLSQFVVTADQAHSWVEVYFPDYGWVTFEPTAGQPALGRQFQRELVPEDLVFESAFEDQLESEEIKQFHLVLDSYFSLAIYVVIFFVVALLVEQKVDSWRLARMEPNQLFSVLYHRLRKLAKRLGVKTYLTDTPFEFADALKNALQMVSLGGIFEPILVSTPEEAVKVIEACNHAAYTNRQLNESNCKEAIHLWRALRWQIFLTIALFRLKSIGTKMKGIWFRNSAA